MRRAGSGLEIGGVEVVTGLPDAGVGLFCDAEGYELTLLDLDAVPQLRHWSIIVELHDFVDPTITETIRARFEERFSAGRMAQEYEAQYRKLIADRTVEREGVLQPSET